MQCMCVCVCWIYIISCIHSWLPTTIVRFMPAGTYRQRNFAYCRFGIYNCVTMVLIAGLLLLNIFSTAVLRWIIFLYTFPFLSVADAAYVVFRSHPFSWCNLWHGILEKSAYVSWSYIPAIIVMSTGRYVAYILWEFDVKFRQQCVVCSVCSLGNTQKPPNELDCGVFGKQWRLLYTWNY